MTWNFISFGDTQATLVPVKRGCTGLHALNRSIEPLLSVTISFFPVSGRATSRERPVHFNPGDVFGPDPILADSPFRDWGAEASLPTTSSNWPAFLV
jgi:hypothetical protein